MTKEELLLIHLGEECAKVVQVISECLKFGLHNTNTKTGISNRETLSSSALEATYQMSFLVEEGIINVPSPEDMLKGLCEYKLKVGKMC